MQYDHILIRYGELALKGKNRKLFIEALHSNVRNKLSNFPNLKIKKTRDRMFIMLNGQEAAPIMDICKKVFGVKSMSVAIKVNSKEEEIKDAALFALNKVEKAKTFKITTKRIFKDFPVDSQQMNQVLGGHLLRNSEGKTVDVHHPDLEIRVEIRKNGTYITSENIAGLGGLPVGSGGKSLLLLSGGIDSPVAGYLAMKRGVKLEAIHFHSPPFTSERAKQKVFDLTEQLAEFTDSIRVHLVPFTDLQKKVHQEIPHGYSMTVMRRMMMRISERIAEKQEILSLTTGENLGQVASQTMESMHAINEVTNYPILRPLVTMDKEEIIKISQEIETYSTSILPYEDCCTIFVPEAPKTKPRKVKVNQFEGSMDFEAELEEAINNTEVITIRPKQGDDTDEFSSLF